MAVVAGFLLTAVPNWTGKPTPTGGTLAVLVALWLAGRVLVLTPYPMAAAVVDAAFPVAIAVAIAGPLVQSRNRRNYFLIAILLALGTRQPRRFISRSSSFSRGPRGRACRPGSTSSCSSWR